jgi:hypothetical protein
MRRHWPSLWNCGNIRSLKKRGHVHRIYQWLYGRASFFRCEAPGRVGSRIVRTEVTVERQGMTLLVGGAAEGFDACPLCGQKLAPAQVEQARLRLQQGSTTEADAPADGTSP